MRKLGLIGYPLGHSYSAKLYNKLFKKHHIEAYYMNLEIQPSELEKTLNEIAKSDDWIGFNITKPYKEKIAEVASLTESARTIGAVNTVVVRGWIGYNTDWIGFYKSLEKLPTLNCATLIGAGGAAKAVAYALLKRGIKKLFILNRTLSRAEKLKDRFTTIFKNVEIEVVPLSESEKSISQSDIVVNATPLGTFPNVDEYPPINFNAFTHEKIAYDLIYNPQETMFLKKARLKGAKTISGIEMFLNQAKENLKLWGFAKLASELENLDILKDLA